MDLIQPLLAVEKGTNEMEIVISKVLKALRLAFTRSGFSFLQEPPFRSEIGIGIEKGSVLVTT